MEKKEILLSKVIALFNKQGCGPTSMRAIAVSCGMSLSNLQHYFTTKEQLLESIFKEMCLVFEGAADFSKNGISLRLLIDMDAAWHLFQQKYKFFFTEINYILQNYTSIRKAFNRIKTKRINEYVQLFSAYMSVEVFQSEPYPGFYYQQAELLWFTANYFLSAQLAEGKKYSTKTREKTNRIVINLIYPLLTVKGRTELTHLNYKVQ